MKEPERMPTQVLCSSQTVLQLRLYAKQLQTLIDIHKDLIDSYVVEFFVKKRWDILPLCWQEALEGLPLDEIATLLLDDPKRKHVKCVWPLSLLAYRAATQALALDPTPTEGDATNIKIDPIFKPIDLLCRLHVKAKKRHEILRLAQVINSASRMASTDRVVDVGSGQGHLSRLLSFGYGLKVTSIEAVGWHLKGAAKVDREIKTIIQHRIAKQSTEPIDGIPQTPPQHVECTVNPQITVEEFLNVINNQSTTGVNEDQSKDRSRVGVHQKNHTSEGLNSEHVLSKLNASRDNLSYVHPQTIHAVGHERNKCTSFPNDTKDETLKSESTTCGNKNSDTFVLAGLHTCGDLAPTMLQVFSKCTQAQALSLVACCYMKMGCAIHPHQIIGPSSPAGEGETTVQNRNSRKRNHFCNSQDSSTLDKNCDVHKHLCDTECGSIVDSDSAHSDVDRTFKGYPMSEFVQGLGGKGIHFEAMELACYSLESSRKRLKDRNPNLILHGYRATLEVIIREFDQEMTRCPAGVRKIKKAVASIRKPHLKTFKEYAACALSSLNIPFEDCHLEEVAKKYEPEWTNVITFHVLRSMMAPIIESLILLDRVLFLFEQGIESKLVPVFDASLSPRNFVLVAVKSP